MDNWLVTVNWNEKMAVVCWVNFGVLGYLYCCLGFTGAVSLYNSLSDDLLHNEDTCFAGLKIVGDLRSFFVCLWILQFGVCAGSSVDCWRICPMGVPLFYTLNNMEFQDNSSSGDLPGCSKSKGIHLAASAVVYCVLPGYHLRILVHFVLHLKWMAEWVG